eukprot:CAMPEP_0181168218 /NCGR_PEP_ID=MMETSP1096-20121128/149_1 /TAXON_ID=156174 ORGANISM="Chrysochromulina ericina, Strain CCMP281" /NCGR_SAMPLE_ID=MMETSP1096 /ASSEMBLY_ACC=CAM_ASM_000453 /LENGTH=98 /DNA_ID=CAMNT_0023255565 /DNA_START=379 /DNA_END=675 /DNA_ORIENTATION=-
MDQLTSFAAWPLFGSWVPPPLGAPRGCACGLVWARRVQREPSAAPLARPHLPNEERADLRTQQRMAQMPLTAAQCSPNPANVNLNAKRERGTGNGVLS